MTTIPEDIKKTLLTAVAYYMGDEATRLMLKGGGVELEKRCLAAIEWVATQPPSPKLKDCTLTPTGEVLS